MQTSILLSNLYINITLSTTELVRIVVGFRRWIIGIDPDEVKALESKVEILEAELKALKEDNIKVHDELREVLKVLNEKADKVDIQDLRLRFNSFMKTLDSLIMKIESLEIGLQGDHLLADDEAKKELILRLIREGYNTPKELKTMVPFGNKKLYEVLKELEREGLIKKLKKRRKVVFVIEEGTY